jgi:hypothetical protein
MRRPLALVVLVVVLLATGCSVRHDAAPPVSPYCRSGDPLAGVYHPSRLQVKSRCRLVTGTVERVRFEDYDGDVHIELRPDDAERGLLSRGNDQVDGTLIVEVIPQDRGRVAVPAVGTRVAVVGPLVDDTTHDWREIHPAWWISAGTIEPASVSELRRARLLLQGVQSTSAGEPDD